MRHHRIGNDRHARMLAGRFLLLGGIPVLVAACGSSPGASDGAADAATDRDVPDARDGGIEDGAADTQDQTDEARDDDSLDGDVIDDDLTTDAVDTDTGDPVPPWQPGYPGFAEPGWRDSDAPLCRRDAETRDIRVWADATAVYFAAVDNGDALRLDVWENQGTAWDPVLSWSDPESAARFMNWSLLGFGGDLWAAGDSGTVRITMAPWAAGVNTDPGRMEAMFVVGTDRAYAIRDAQVIWYDGTSWGPYPGEPLPSGVSPTALWGDRDEVFVGARGGVVLSSRQDRWTVHDTGLLSDITAIGGTSPGDVWAGTRDGRVLHVQDGIWSEVVWAIDAGAPNACFREGAQIEQILAIDGTVLLRTGMAIGRATGNVVETLANWPGLATGSGDACDRALTIVDMWATSPTDLFLAVLEDAAEPHPCMEHLLHWDGETFHWF